MDFLTLQALAIPVGLMVIGIALLIKGGDWTIDSSVFIARKFGLSPMVVGFTILAFGTSLPELLVSILAVIRGSAGIAMGNVIGSNIANILLVMGASAMIATMHVTISKGLVKDLVMMCGSAILLTILMQLGTIGALAGGSMITLLLIYVFLQYRMAQKGEIEVGPNADEALPEHKHAWQPYIMLFIGLAAVAGGAKFLVDGASQSAAILHVPEDIIALSVIAIGTSLPELSTSIIGARKGHAEMALGNIVGSNVFNILLIIGLTAMVKPIAQSGYSPQLLNFDIWFMLAITFVFAAIITFYKKITPAIGIMFLGTYLMYTIYIYAINVSV